MPNSTGIILMTYGSATTAENVGSYMEHIYKSQIPEGIVEDFADRYRQVGRSPLVDITTGQASLLEALLNEPGTDTTYTVRAGMLHSAPFIGDAVAECRAAGAEQITGIILSPQFSSFIMDGYRMSLEAAGASSGYDPSHVRVAGPWPDQPDFTRLLVSRIQTGLAKLKPKFGDNIPVIFTTHSLPERVVAKDPSYLDQLKVTTSAVVTKLGDNTLEYYEAYQSAGHSPEPWLKPDLVDILAKLKDAHRSAVLIVPIQFLSDHLEILYDLDIAGQEQCDEFKISYNRTELPNTDARFITALANIAREASNFTRP